MSERVKLVLAAGGTTVDVILSQHEATGIAAMLIHAAAADEEEFVATVNSPRAVLHEPA